MLTTCAAASNYVELGAIATDILDDSVTLSRAIEQTVVKSSFNNFTGVVNTFAAAYTQFVVQYNVMDNAGNRALTINRTVEINDGILPVLTILGNCFFSLLFFRKYFGRLVLLLYTQIVCHFHFV